MMKNLKNVIVTGLAPGILGSAAVEAADWPQWGGNTLGRNMYAAGAAVCRTKFSRGLQAGTEDVDLSTAKNFKWAAKLGTQSYGNPTSPTGEFLSALTTTRCAIRSIPATEASCLPRRKGGEFLWQLVIPKLKSGKVNDWESLGPLSSRRWSETVFML
ncbi:MAG: hypothetical protein CM1200mP29_11210 [Verrucomicrobiota bacterium]|nr:MAG: hypothetical protein CM1200mP29_11210 [Verrucomicrobiota bacterium]